MLEEADQPRVVATELSLGAEEQEAGIARATEIVLGRAVIVVCECVDGWTVVGSHVVNAGVNRLMARVRALEWALGRIDQLRRQKVQRAAERAALSMAPDAPGAGKAVGGRVDPAQTTP